MTRMLSVLTQRAEPLAMDALVDALKRRGFQPRIEVGGDGDLVLRDRRDPRGAGVVLGWARPAHKDKVPALVGRVVLSYDLALGARSSGWDHFLYLNAALSAAELARGFIYDGEEALTATTFAERLVDQGALPFAGEEAVARWEAATGGLAQTFPRPASEVSALAAKPLEAPQAEAVPTPALPEPRSLAALAPAEPPATGEATQAAVEEAFFAPPSEEPVPAPTTEAHEEPSAPEEMAVAPLSPPHTPPRERGALPPFALTAGTSLSEAVNQVIDALATEGIGAARLSSFGSCPFEVLALHGETEDLLVVATEPWTAAMEARAIRRLGPMRTQKRARIRFATAAPLSPRLAYLFALDGKGDLELDLLAAAREMPPLSATSAPTLAALGKELLQRRMGVGIPSAPETALKLIDRIVLDALRPVRERTVALDENAYVPECTLVTLGCAAGEVLRSHPALTARWVDGADGLPVIEARRRSADPASEPARTGPVARAFDLYKKGVAWRFEALLPRPPTPRAAPTYSRPTQRPSLRTAPHYATPAPAPARWWERLLDRIMPE